MYRVASVPHVWSELVTGFSHKECNGDDKMCMVTLHKIVCWSWGRDSLLYWLWAASCPLWAAHGEAMWQEMRAASTQHSARNWGPQSDRLQGTECWQNFVSPLKTPPITSSFLKFVGESTINLIAATLNLNVSFSSDCFQQLLFILGFHRFH